MEIFQEALAEREMRRCIYNLRRGCMWMKGER